MTATLKDNVNSFNRDVLENKGYVYTTNNRFSSIVANQRQTEATIKAIDPESKKILDIGCGDGVYTAKLKAAFPSIAFTGLDPAVEAIRNAEKEYAGISLLVGNALDTATLQQETYDIGIFRGVLHHTSDPALAIKNMAKHAEKLIIIEPNGNNLILKIIEKVSKYHRDHEERSFFPSVLQRWCEEAGYEIQSLDYAGFVPFFFPTLPAKIIYALQPFLETIPVLRNLFSAVSIIQCKKRSQKSDSSK